MQIVLNTPKLKKDNILPSHKKASTYMYRHINYCNTYFAVK